MGSTDRHTDRSRWALSAMIPVYHQFSSALIFTLLLAVHTLFTDDSANPHGCRARHIYRV